MLATSAASHELGEAVVDPFSFSPAWDQFDGAHLAWKFYQQFNEEVFKKAVGRDKK